MNINDHIKLLLESKKAAIQARLFVTREDGITIYDSVQDQTTTSVAALVSGVWQASEALMGLVQKNQDVMDFRFAFDTSAKGIYLFPFFLNGKRYFLGAIYGDCLNPGQLKRKIALVKDELDRHFEKNPVIAPDAKAAGRDGFLFKDISDEEMDRLFSLNGI